MTDTKDANPILALIDKAVEEKTFSLDALTAIQKIKEQAEKLASDLERSQSYSKAQQRDIAQSESDIRALNTKLDGWQKRESELASREAKVTQLELTSAVSQAESRVINPVIDHMFANRQFRETIIENGMTPMPGMPGMGPTMMSTNKNVTTDHSVIK